MRDPDCKILRSLGSHIIIRCSYTWFIFEFSRKYLSTDRRLKMQFEARSFYRFYLPASHSPLQAADKTMIILLNNFLIELVSINYKNNSVHMATSQRYGQCCAIFLKKNISKALPLPFAFTTTSGGHNGSAINNLIWQALLWCVVIPSAYCHVMCTLHKKIRNSMENKI